MTESTAAPRRLHFNRYAGGRLPPGSRLVTRPGKWGNPIKVEGGDREACVLLYREWVFDPEREPFRDRVRAELRGLDLACACPLDGRPCHADVLLEIANQGKEPKR